MDSDRFAEIVDGQLALCKDVLVDKAREYATEDRLHNFKVAADIQGVDLLEACAGMMAKHTVSIYAMCGSEQEFCAAQWDEKITDHINYLIILRAIVFEMRDTEEENQTLFVFDELPDFKVNQSTPYEDLAKALHRMFNDPIAKSPGKAL